jgi:hypothetical protein
MIGCSHFLAALVCASADLSTPQYAWIMRDGVLSIGLEPSAYGRYSMRRIKVAQIYVNKGNLRASIWCTNENTNGQLRQYFPKRADLGRHGASDLQAVAEALNIRPRKTLGWKAPAEALDEMSQEEQHRGVATTG